MSALEWESLCDGCAKCCLVKLEDVETEELHTTSVVCALLDQDLCRCRDYPNRHVHVPTCVKLSPQNVGALDWMPQTCAYRLLANGKDLPWWHPLVSGDPNTVHDAGISVRYKVISEDEVVDEDLEDYIVAWPDN